jgi:hypothetical protein
MIQKSIYKYLFFVFLFISGFARAQFRNTAKIDSVKKPGFYTIDITPVLSSLVKTDFSDLRIVDEAGNQVPYLLGNSLPTMDTTRLRSLKIIQNILNDSGQSVLIIENGKDEKTDGLYLHIRNAAVSRTIAFSGSNDGKSWFSIIENVSLEKQFVQNQDNITEYISFPLSSYRYFRLIVYNGKNDPLDIVSVQKSAGKGLAKKDTVLINPSRSFIRKDSNKLTSLVIKNLKDYHIDVVELKVTGPKFYKRQLDLFTGEELKGSYTVSSDTLIILSLPVFNDSIFTIKIYNEDNPPLTISDILTGQRAEKLITYLESGKSYHLEMNNKNSSAPHYDLGNFKDSIPATVQAIGFSDIIASPLVKKTEVDGSKQPWLWPALIFALIVLGLLTYGLTKDMAKKS